MTGDVRTVVNARFPRAARSARTAAREWGRLGEQTAFYVEALVNIRQALTRYMTETLRVLAEMSLGVGALALLGGEVVVLAVLTGAGAAVVGIFGYVQASSLGVGAIAGFFSAYANVRLQLPLVVANGLQGTFFHWRGVLKKPGGKANLRYNIEMGPPAFAPLLASMVGGMGLLASLLRREGQ